MSELWPRQVLLSKDIATVQVNLEMKSSDRTILEVTTAEDMNEGFKLLDCFTNSTEGFLDCPELLKSCRSTPTSIIEFVRLLAILPLIAFALCDSRILVPL